MKGFIVYGILVVLLAIPFKGGCQHRTVDSLLTALKTSKEDTIKERLLIRIASEYENNQPDSAIFFLNLSFELSKKLKYDRGYLRYYNEYSGILTMQNKFDESNEMLAKALDIAIKLNSKRAISSVYSNIAWNYAGKGSFEKSLDYDLKAMRLIEELRDTFSLGIIYGNIAGVYDKLHQPEKGYEYGVKAIAYCRAIHDDHDLANALINTSNTLSDMRKFDSALVLLTESKSICDKANDLDDKLTTILNIDNVYKAQANYPALYKEANEAMGIAEKLGNKTSYCLAVLDLAYYYLAMKDYGNATLNATKALNLSKENALLASEEQAYQILGDIELSQGKLEQCNIYRSLKDSVSSQMFSDKILKNTQELNTKYETAQKEEKIKLQAAEIRANRLWNGFLIVALVAAFLVTILAVKGYRNKQKLLLSTQQLQLQKILQLEQEKQLSATQSVLQGQEEERTRLAKDLHDGLGGMLSGIKFSFGHMKENLIMTPENQQSFERSMDMLDTSIRELRRVAHNMMPESLIKFGLDAALNDQCNYINQSGIVKATYQSVGVEKASIDKNIAVNVYRIVQELLNNVMKHAVATEVLVQLIIEGSRFSITVEDNGKGFDALEIERKDGIGWANIRNRVDYLNGKMDVQSSPEKGTSVFIEFNV